MSLGVMRMRRLHAVHHHAAIGSESRLITRLFSHAPLTYTRYHDVAGPVPSPHPSDLSLGQQIDLSRREAVRTRLIQQDRTVHAPSPVLMDRFNRQHTYLRISLTEKCNLRCRYCMPAEGVPLMPNEDALTGPEIARLARLFVSEGVRKIRLTGGEPTLRRDLIDIVADLGKLRGQGLQQIGITTNGVTLTRQLRGLLDNGLTHLNISLDTLDPLKFELLTRRPAAGLRKVLDGIDLALQMNALIVKLNVVILRGVNDNDDVLQFVEWAKDRPLVVRFIEYMPFDGNRWRPEKLVPYRELLDRIKRRYGDLQRAKDDPNDTSKHWRVPGHTGSLGFITSMTDHFCGTCNRLRITADGKIKVCGRWLLVLDGDELTVYACICAVRARSASLAMQKYPCEMLYVSVCQNTASQERPLMRSSCKSSAQQWAQNMPGTED